MLSGSALLSTFLTGLFLAAPPVAVRIDRAEAQWQSDGQLLIRCQATLTNNTGSEISTHSTFATAFDGLQLVGLAADGKPVLRQPYVFHQSPHADAAAHPLPLGETSQTLAFPVHLEAAPPALQVRLEGELPGTRFAALVSNTLGVAIPASPGQLAQLVYEMNHQRIAALEAALEALGKAKLGCNQPSADLVRSLAEAALRPQRELLPTITKVASQLSQTEGDRATVHACERIEAEQRAVRERQPKTLQTLFELGQRCQGGEVFQKLYSLFKLGCVVG
jgi:hypothetical protein